MHSLNAPESAKKSIESLASYLMVPAKDEVETARAVFRWIAENIDYDVQGLFSGNVGDTSAEDVLKSGRSVCGGYSNLFERLANASGLEVVTISGYAKGYGYTPGMRFSGPTDHAWNAIKINEKWYLTDSTWGAGNIDDEGMYNREFDDYYFMTPPEDFIYAHFPEDPKWQLLDNPISKKEFEDLVCLKPAFFKLGLRLGNQKNITIISNGQANITLYSAKGISITAKLERLSNDKHSQRAYGKPTLVKRSGEQYIIELLPPFPGEYILRVFGKRENNRENIFKEVLEYKVVELSGTDRSFPVVFDDFFDLGFKLGNQTNGRIIADGEANVSLDVPSEVLIIADLEKLGGDKSSSNDNRNSVFVQRTGDQYKISLLPPVAGEYILNIYAKRKTDSGNSYSGIVQFNVTALSGTDRSFPVVFDDFFDLGFKLGNQTNGRIIADGEANVSLDVPSEVLIIADLEKLGGDKSSSNDNRNSVFVQRTGNQYKISLLPPVAGEYILNIYAKRKTDSGNSYSGIMQFNVMALSGTDRSFPEIFGDFQKMEACLYYPLTDKITAGQNQSFKIRLQDAEKVAVICGDYWNYLTRTGDGFQGNASIKKGDVDVAVKLQGSELYTNIIRYEAI